MQDPTTIVVHPGKSHMDDFLSCCLLLAKYPSIGKIDRREPTEDDLNDQTVLVIDVGGQCVPVLRNYDHHQFDRDHEPCCALTLVVRHELNMEDQFREHEWFIFTEMLDSKGPNVVAEHFGWNKFPFEARSPLDRMYLKSFEDMELTCETEEGRFCLNMLGALGEQLIQDTKEWSEKLQECKENSRDMCVTLSGGHYGEYIQGIIMLGDPELTPCMHRVRELHYPNAAFSITLDQRGEGYCIYRYDDDPRLDFSRLEESPLIEFAHKVGFLCTTKEKLPLDQLNDLIRQAIT